MYMSAFENGSVCSAGPGQTISTAVEVALPFGECRTLPPVSPSAFYYKFALTASEWLSAALTASPGSVYRLDLYDPQLSLKKSSLSVQSGQTNLSLTVDSTGEWVLGVVNQSDQTTYDIQINAAFPPSSPVNPSSVGRANYVLVSWEGPASDGGLPVLGFRLYRGLSPSTEILYRALGAAQLSFNDFFVDCLRTYWYRLTAETEAGESSPSSEVSAYPVCAPSAPQGLEATAGTGQVTLTWAAPV